MQKYKYTNKYKHTKNVDKDQQLKERLRPFTYSLFNFNLLELLKENDDPLNNRNNCEM